MAVLVPFLTNKSLQLAAVMSESLLVGSYLVMSIVIVILLIVKFTFMPLSHRFLFGCSLFMFFISVVHLGLVLHELSLAAIPRVNIQAQMVLTMCQFITGEIILIWRLWAIWGRRLYVTLLPVALMLAGAALSLRAITEDQNRFDILSVSLVTGNTVLCIVLVACRLWYMQRIFIKATKQPWHPGRFKYTLAGFFASGLLYTAVQVVSIVLFVTKSIALPFFLDLEIPLIGILPSFIIILVHYDWRVNLTREEKIRSTAPGKALLSLNSDVQPSLENLVGGRGAYVRGHSFMDV